MVIRQLTLTTNDGRLTHDGNQTNTTETRRENVYATGTRLEIMHTEGTEDGAAACTKHSKTAQRRVPRVSSMYDTETHTQRRVRQKRHKRDHMYNNCMMMVVLFRKSKREFLPNNKVAKNRVLQEPNTVFFRL